MRNKILLIVVVIVLLFAFLNPSNADFKVYLAANDYVVNKRDDDITYGKIANYFLFSVYQFNVSNEGVGGRYVTTTTFYGFLKNFKKGERTTTLIR